MPTASHPEVPRRTAERRPRADSLLEPAIRAERARRLERSPGEARRDRAERSPVRRLATLVSARPYLDVNG